jgi:maltose alpha-D-glucosyltransferase/alpha-amylase
MQWTDEPSAGFSTANPGDLRRPLPGGEYGPEHVNVRAQRRDPGSLLNWFERIIRLRRETPEVGWGDWTILDTRARALVAMRYDWQSATLVTVHNFATDAVTVDLDLTDVDWTAARDLRGDDIVEPTADGRLVLEIGRYGYRWMRLETGQRATPYG